LIAIPAVTIFVSRSSHYYYFCVGDSYWLYQVYGEPEDQLIPRHRSKTLWAAYLWDS